MKKLTTLCLLIVFLVWGLEGSYAYDCNPVEVIVDDDFESCPSLLKIETKEITVAHWDRYSRAQGYRGMRNKICLSKQRGKRRGLALVSPSNKYRFWNPLVARGGFPKLMVQRCAVHTAE